MIQDSKTPEQLLHESEAATLLAVSPRTLRNWRCLGHGPSYIKISGRCIRYRQSDLLSFIEANSRQHSSEDLNEFLPGRS